MRCSKSWAGLLEPALRRTPWSCYGGWWFAPTVLDGCSIDSAVAQEEVFGPLVTLHPFETVEEAVEMANCTKYGLAASVWSSDLHKAHTIASQLEAGTVWVNCWLHRELHMPFGGVKASGVAREGGLHSLDFYSEASTICVKLGETAPPPMPGGPKPARPRAAPPASTAPMGQLPGGGQRRGMRTMAAAAAAAAAATAAGAAYCQPRFMSSSSFVSDAPKPLGAYTHAREVKAGEGLLFLAGIGPREPGEGNTVPGGPVEDGDGQRREYDATAQSKQCIANVERVLAASGLTLSDVIDVHAFLIDMKRDFKAFNAVYADAFGGLPTPPTRTTIEVGELPPGGRIAVELKVVARMPPAS